MKIYSKKVKYRSSNDYSDVVIVKVYFKPKSSNTLLFETIDYDKFFEVRNSRDWRDEHVQDVFYHLDYDKQVNVLDYDENKLVFAAYDFPEMKSKYLIKLKHLMIGLEEIFNHQDFTFLESNFTLQQTNFVFPGTIKHPFPSIEAYIAQHPDAFKTVYYPGAGDDFSALQLFGMNGNTEQVIYTDYFNTTDITAIRERIDQFGEQVVNLSPKHYNKRTWSEFWPKAGEWEGSDYSFSLDLHHPDHAWGRQLLLKSDDRSEKQLKFTQETISSTICISEIELHL